MKRTYSYSNSSVIVEIISALLILLFAYTALNKFQHRIVFVDVLRQSPLLQSDAVLLSWSIPVVEISIAIALLFNYTRLIALYGSLVVLILFTVYILYMLLGNSHLPCSCGGFIEHLSWRQHLLFNLIFIVLTMIGIFLSTYYVKKRSRPRPLFGS